MAQTEFSVAALWVLNKENKQNISEKWVGYWSWELTSQPQLKEGEVHWLLCISKHPRSLQYEENCMKTFCGRHRNKCDKSRSKIRCKFYTPKMINQLYHIHHSWICFNENWIFKKRGMLWFKQELLQGSTTVLCKSTKDRWSDFEWQIAMSEG